MGDDERFECIYKFVSRDAYDPTDRAAQSRAAGPWHALRRADSMPTGRRMAPARTRPGGAQRRERVPEPGRRADQARAGRRRGRRHEDGPAGMDRRESAPARSTCALTNNEQRGAKDKPGRCRPIPAPRTRPATSSAGASRAAMPRHRGSAGTSRLRRSRAATRSAAHQGRAFGSPDGLWFDARGGCGSRPTCRAA